MPSTALIVPLPANRLFNKLAPKVSNKIPRNPSIIFFPSFLIVWLTRFINKPDSSSELTIFINSFISLLEIFNFVTPDPKIFLWIAAFVADADAVKDNGIKRLLANGLSSFPIKSNPVFSDGTKILPKNPPDCPILCSWIFDDFILSEELFAKALGSLKTCVLVNNNLCGKWILSLKSSTTFDESFRVTSLPFFVPDFN